MNYIENIEIDNELKTVWLVTINNPPANCLTLKIISGLDQAIDAFEKDCQSRIMILTGAGSKFFSAGVDINQIASIQAPKDGAELARHGQNLCNKIEKLNKPIIAAINGMCNGGGCEIALACQYRIASIRASFQQPEVSLGIIPAFGATQRLPRVVGKSQTFRMIIMCEKITAHEAARIGLIDELVESSELVDRAKKIAINIANKSRCAVLESLMAINDAAYVNLSDGLEKEIEHFKTACGSNDMNEAIVAFREKRKPNFLNSISGASREL